MDISLRTQQLNSLFSYDKKARLEESRLEITPFRFTQTIGASEINEFQKKLGTDKRFPPRYTEPFAFAQKGTIKATSYDRTFDKSSPVPVKESDIPASNYTVIYPKDEKTIAMFDGNGYTTFYLPKGKQEIRFPAVKGNKIRLVVTRIIENQPQAGIGEFSVITE